jgi:Ankyrin repeat
MTFKHRAGVLLFLPMLFFGLGSLTAGVATSTATFIAPEPATLLDAVAGGNDEAMVRMISEGEDPGLPAVLKRPVLYWARGETVSPLLLAIGGGDINKVAYMAKHTQQIAAPPNDQGLCAAARYGHTNVVRFLIKMGVPAVPREGCGMLKRPEDIAAKYGSSGLAKELQQYRTGAD